MFSQVPSEIVVRRPSLVNVANDLQIPLFLELERRLSVGALWDAPNQLVVLPPAQPTRVEAPYITHQAWASPELALPAFPDGGSRLASDDIV